MHPLSYHMDSFFFVFFWDPLLGPLIPVKQLTSTRGARLWTLDKGVTAFGDICRCLSFSDSCLFSRALVSVPPPRGCQELQRIQQTDSGWVRLPELCATRFQSRSSQSFQSLLDTQRTQFFLFSLTGTSQSRPIRALITLLTDEEALLSFTPSPSPRSVLCQEAPPTLMQTSSWSPLLSLLYFSPLFRGAFESELFLKVKCIQMYASFQ